jgi:hypothetical protein
MTRPLKGPGRGRVEISTPNDLILENGRVREAER